MENNFKYPSIKQSSRSDTFILISIDTILDTRIGVIGQSDPELAGKILSSGKYFNRLFDEFEGITNAEFKKLYSERNADTLPHCIVTNVSYFLQRLVKDAIMADAVSPNDDKLVVHLNVWPYKDLTEEELNSFRDAVRFYTYSYAEVVIINKSIEELTPIHCKESYDIILMYDYEEYITTHVKALEKTQMPALSFIVPTMYRNGLPTPDDLAEIKKLNINPFAAIETALLPVIGLKMMPVSLFSIAEKINPDNKDFVLDSVRYTKDILTEVMNKNNGITTAFNMDETPNPIEEIMKPIDDEMI